MKDGITTAITTICALGLCLLLFGTLVPWYAETFGDAEHEINTNLCPKTEYQVINQVTYCAYKGRWVKPRDYIRLIK